MSKQVKDLIENYKKGTYTTLTAKRRAKTYKSCLDDIYKITVYKNARLGIGYDNLAQTKQNRATGELPESNQGLKWGRWVYYPYLIKHKGNEYLRIYADLSKVETIWVKNGKPVDKSSIEHQLLSSEKNRKPSKDRFATLTINTSTFIF